MFSFGGIFMHWLIQSGIKDIKFSELENVLTRLSVGFTKVRSIPFLNKIIAEDTQLIGESQDIPELSFAFNDPVFICGSYSLALASKKMGLVPGAFVSSDLNLISCLKSWGHEMLNSSAQIGTIDELVPTYDVFFARPVLDAKSFSGTVFKKDDYMEWVGKLRNLGESTLPLTTEVLLCPIKEIWAEYRFFVVDGKVVTGSLYKRGNTVLYDSFVPPEVLSYAQQMVDLWQPDLCFVLDVADTPIGYKIIEVNNINSAGFYAVDMFKLVVAIEELTPKYSKQ